MGRSPAIIRGINMTEKELAECTWLVAQFYHSSRGRPRLPYAHLLDIQRRLLVLGVILEHPIEAPDPTAPEGGSAVSLRKAA